MAPNRMRADVREALASCRSNVESFLALPAATPFGEVVRAYDRLLQPLNGTEGRVQLFVTVLPDADERAGCEELEQEISTLRTELSLHRGVFERLRVLEPSDAADALEARVHEHALRDFRRSGVDRDEATRENIRALQEELVKIGQEFDRNITNGGRDFVISEGHAAMVGLPADFLASHPEREDGSVVLTTDMNDRFPFLMYAERADLRRDYHLASMNRAMPENLEVLRRMIAKRHELAQLLGFGSWAEYVTEDKMSGSAQVASDFIARVVELARPRGLAEREELLEHKRQADTSATTVMEWERYYLTDRIKNERYGFDSQAVRQYFAYDCVRDGVLATAAALYGVEFRRNDTEEPWHETVECYDVVDGEQVTARFYLDMHPREGKHKHASMFGTTEGVSGETPPEAVLVCNFPEPTDTDPGLLLHDEVKTYFHEFGHLLHQLFGGQQSYLRFSGIATEMDFVEVPSQLFEEWAWNAGVLRQFARHTETGEPIPEDLVARMRAADEYGKALHTLGQMYCATLSLRYYTVDPAELDVTQMMLDVKAEVVPLDHEEGNNFHASFEHLNEYSAMYYTYMWSLVISKDLFSRFEGDLMNGDTANDYRAAVLAPGGSRDARELVSSFLGREYGFDAFEKWLMG